MAEERKFKLVPLNSILKDDYNSSLNTSDPEKKNVKNIYFIRHGESLGNLHGERKSKKKGGKVILGFL